jgi:hypothetical protein
MPATGVGIGGDGGSGGCLASLADSPLVFLLSPSLSLLSFATFLVRRPGRHNVLAHLDNMATPSHHLDDALKT